jgi:hypothetical protein
MKPRRARTQTPAFNGKHPRKVRHLIKAMPPARRAAQLGATERKRREKEVKKQRQQAEAEF